MEKAHRRLIQRNFPALVTDLDYSSLMTHIISAEIYPDRKLEAFQSIADKQKQNTDFLMDIQRRGPKAFGVLVRALRSAKQPYLAALLDPGVEFPTDGPAGGSPINYGSPVSGSDRMDEKDAPWAKEKNECYPMAKNPRGIVLIINNETFLDRDTLPNRDGTNKDVERVEELFDKKLGFLVVKKQNLGLAAMKQLYEEYQKVDHSAYDCFVSVILSHGLDNGICGVDYDKKKSEVLSIEEVVAGMDSCPSLQGKPKVFLTQACRGEKVHKPRKITMDARRPSQDVAEDFERLNLQKKEPTGERMHVGSDVLIAFPCIKGYSAAREPDQGTWFIKSLCEVLDEDHHKKHLMDMLTKVNDEVGKNRGSMDGNIVTQTSEFSTTLKKRLYFPPCHQKQGQQPTN